MFFSGLKNDFFQLSKLSEKVRKFELCHFLCRKKLGKLDLIIFNGGKRCGKLDFVIFDGGKVWKVGKSHFLGQKKTFFCGKIDLVIS
jgi:hypothetical protein